MPNTPHGKSALSAPSSRRTKSRRAYVALVAPGGVGGSQLSRLFISAALLRSGRSNKSNKPEDAGRDFPVRRRRPQTRKQACNSGLTPGRRCRATCLPEETPGVRRVRTCSRGLREKSSLGHLPGAEVRPAADVRLMEKTSSSRSRDVFRTRAAYHLRKPEHRSARLKRRRGTNRRVRATRRNASPSRSVRRSIFQIASLNSRTFLAGGNFVKRPVLRRANLAFGHALPSAFQRGG